MKRREFIALLGGAAAWPLEARAQQRERMRRIGVLVGGLSADDPEWQARSNAFIQGLQERGWSDGRNMRVEYRWGLSETGRPMPTRAMSPRSVKASTKPAPSKART